MSEYRSTRVPQETIVAQGGSVPDLHPRSVTYPALQCVVDCTQARAAGERIVRPVHFAEQLPSGGHAEDIGLLWVGVDGWTYSDDVRPQAACPEHSHESHPWVADFLREVAANDAADAGDDDGQSRSLDRIVELLRERGITNSHVEHTGGGCATVYAGPTFRLPSEDWDRHTLIAGPGSFDAQARAFVHFSEFRIGKDDDGATPAVAITEGTHEEIADRMIAFIEANEPQNTDTAVVPKAGDKVWWTDPDGGASSGVYEVTHADAAADAGDCSVSLKNGAGSEVDCFVRELRRATDEEIAADAMGASDP